MMAVSVGILREVEAELKAEGLCAADVGRLMKKREFEDNPDTPLAQAIRSAFYNDSSLDPLYRTPDAERWLRMAAAAREYNTKVEMMRAYVDRGWSDLQIAEEIGMSVSDVHSLTRGLR